jgi:hypothetical protein
MVSLLLLWDELEIPHEEHKQVYGSPLPVIGFEVDPNFIKITLKEESKIALVAEIREFARYKSKRSLQDFEHIAGSLNWALNVALLLKLGLSAIYVKIKGKSNTKGMIWMNHSVVHELLLAAFHLERSDGIYLLKSLSWQLHCLPLDVLQIYCDMLGMGMGFCICPLTLGFKPTFPVILQLTTSSIMKLYMWLVPFVTE